MKLVLIVMMVVLLFQPMGCATGTADKINPNNEYPVIKTFVDVGRSAEETFGVTFDLETANLPYDAFYVLPSAAHIQQIEKFCLKMRLGAKWTQESWDCDDYSRETLYLAKRWSHLTYTGVPATVCYGSAYVRIVGHYPLGRGMGSSPESPSYHVLNIYLRNDGVWMALEPQNRRTEPVLSLVYEGVVEFLRIEL